MGLGFIIVVVSFTGFTISSCCYFLQQAGHQKIVPKIRDDFVTWQKNSSLKKEVKPAKTKKKGVAMSFNYNHLRAKKSRLMNILRLFLPLLNLLKIVGVYKWFFFDFYGFGFGLDSFSYCFGYNNTD